MSARRIGCGLLLAGACLASCVPPDLTASPRPSATSSPPTAQASSSPVATPTPTRRLLVTPTPLPTNRLALGLVEHENPILGYRITLPETRRRSASGLVPTSEEGYDYYTARTEAEDRTACLSDAGGQPGPEGEPDLRVGASLDPAGMSAEAWVTTPRFPSAQPMSTHMLVERTTIDGKEAVRLVRDQATNHETSGYVVRANDRIYTLGFDSDSIPSRLPGWLDSVAATFRVIQPLPFPTASPPPPIAPRDAARDVGLRLSRAFAARDVDAIAGLITPRCWLSLWPWTPPGVGVDGSSRAVVPFLDALRASFARGTVAVVVDPEVQTEVEGTGAFQHERFYVRSDWTASGATLRMDLFLDVIDDTTYWVAARHYTAPLAPCSDLRFIFGNAGFGQC